MLLYFIQIIASVQKNIRMRIYLDNIIEDNGEHYIMFGIRIGETKSRNQTCIYRIYNTLLRTLDRNM